MGCCPDLCHVVDRLQLAQHKAHLQPAGPAWADLPVWVADLLSEKRGPVYVGVSAPCENVVQRNQPIDNKFTECTKYSTNNELTTHTRARHAGSCD